MATPTEAWVASIARKSEVHEALQDIRERQLLPEVELEALNRILKVVDEHGIEQSCSSGRLSSPMVKQAQDLLHLAGAPIILQTSLVEGFRLFVQKKELKNQLRFALSRVIGGSVLRALEMSLLASNERAARLHGGLLDSALEMSLMATNERAARLYGGLLDSANTGQPNQLGTLLFCGLPPQEASKLYWLCLFSDAPEGAKGLTLSYGVHLFSRACSSDPYYALSNLVALAAVWATSGSDGGFWESVSSVELLKKAGAFDSIMACMAFSEKEPSGAVIPERLRLLEVALDELDQRPLDPPVAERLRKAILDAISVAPALLLASLSEHTGVDVSIGFLDFMLRVLLPRVKTCDLQDRNEYGVKSEDRDRDLRVPTEIRALSGVPEEAVALLEKSEGLMSSYRQMVCLLVSQLLVMPSADSQLTVWDHLLEAERTWRLPPVGNKLCKLFEVMAWWGRRGNVDSEMVNCLRKSVVGARERMRESGGRSSSAMFLQETKEGRQSQDPHATASARTPPATPSPARRRSRGQSGCRPVHDSPLSSTQTTTGV